MDYDSSSKFISSLAKFLQSLCNGYVEFDSGVQVIGHLYLSVDTGKTIDYILNEKVCKTDENSVTFISNSFHAQPAERPKPPGKKTIKDSEKPELKSDEDNENFINAQGEPKSTNIGTLPPTRNVNKNSPHLQGAKRPFSPSHKSQPKTGQTSPRHKKSRTESLDQNISQLSNPASENSISSAPSPAADNVPQNTVSTHSSGDPPVSHLNESYQQSYFHPDEESSLADESEERDIKPSIDTDVTFIKEEYAPSSSCSQSGRDRTHVDEAAAYSYQTNQVFPGNYPGQSSFGASQRSNFNSSGSSHMFSPGLSSSKLEENSGDPSGAMSAKRKSYSVEYKREIVEDSRRMKLTAFCKAKNLDVRMVRKWRADYDNLGQQADLGNAKKRKCGSGRQPLFPDLEDIICDWVADRRSKELVVSRADIQAFALAMAPQLEISLHEFKASHHWLDGFLQRYELSLRRSPSSPSSSSSVTH